MTARDKSRVRSIKAVLIGESTVGKTSIVNVANTGEFNEGLRPTVGACFLVNTYNVQDTTIKLNIWDTAGQERYRALAPMYFRDMNIAVICYAIDNKASFDAVDDWFNTIRDEMPSMPTLYLIANKRDLVDDRQVLTEQGEKKAAQIGAIFYEISAKVDKQGIAEIFQKMAEECVKKVAALSNESANISNLDQSRREKKGCCK